MHPDAATWWCHGEDPGEIMVSDSTALPLWQIEPK